MEQFGGMRDEGGGSREQGSGRREEGAGIREEGAEGRGTREAHRGVYLLVGTVPLHGAFRCDTLHMTGGGRNDSEASQR